MKKNILTIILLVITTATNAQLVSSSSLVITKAKLPPVKTGYEQYIEASYTMMMKGSNSLEVNISYIGGYRFNENIFLGAGTGISIMDTRKEGHWRNMGDYLSCPTANIPLYIHFKAYFLKSRVSPFIAMSAGGRFSTKKEFELETGEGVRYGTVGLYLNPSIGVNYRLSAKNSIYFSVGFKGTTVQSIDELDYNLLTVKDRFVYGIDYHIGFTF